MNSRNLDTSWKKETQWLIVADSIMATLQTTDFLSNKRLRESKIYSGEDEIVVTQAPHLKRLNFKIYSPEILVDNIHLKLTPKSSFRVNVTIERVQKAVFRVRKPEIEY